MSKANPHFKFPERAPYELGWLVERIPENFVSAPLTADQVNMLHAAGDHAANYSHNLIHGIEAIGHLLFAAGVNDDSELDRGVVSSTGMLITALAVQVQYLNDLQQRIDRTVSKEGAAA